MEGARYCEYLVTLAVVALVGLFSPRGGRCRSTWAIFCGCGTGGVDSVALVSVDVVGTMRRPVGLGVLVETAQRMLARLLGMEGAPSIEVFADRRYEEGRRVDAGHRLTGEALEAVLIGNHLPGPVLERPTLHFEFEIPETGDGVWLMVIDHSEQPAEPVDAIFSPCRTCAGVVLATVLALAAAEQGGGEFLDEEIRMLRPPITDPRQVIEHTRLQDERDDFAARCRRYMRQFPQLGGWPRDASMAG